MSRRPLCSNDKHTWRPVRRSKFEKCTTCGTYFPCKKAGCDHSDCHEARGEGPPSWKLVYAEAA